MVALSTAGESKTDNDGSLKQFEQIYWQFGQKWMLQNFFNDYSPHTAVIRSGQSEKAAPLGHSFWNLNKNICKFGQINLLIFTQIRFLVDSLRRLHPWNIFSERNYNSQTLIHSSSLEAKWQLHRVCLSNVTILLSPPPSQMQLIVQSVSQQSFGINKTFMSQLVVMLTIVEWAWKYSKIYFPHMRCIW